MSRAWAFLLGLLAILGGAAGIHRAGKKAGELETENEAMERTVDAKRIHDEIKHDVATSSGSADRLRSKWARD